MPRDWVKEIEDITRCYEHMKFIFELKKIFTSEHGEPISFYYIDIECFKKKKLDEKQRNDVRDIFTR